MLKMLYSSRELPKFSSDDIPPSPIVVGHFASSTSSIWLESPYKLDSESKRISTLDETSTLDHLKYRICMFRRFQSFEQRVQMRDQIRFHALYNVVQEIKNLPVAVFHLQNIFTVFYWKNLKILINQGCRPDTIQIAGGQGSPWAQKSDQNVTLFHEFHVKVWSENGFNRFVCA